MDQNRQKLMIGVLAVLALGAGVYWGFIRESSSAAVVQEDTGPAEVKQRRVAQNTDKKAVKERTAARPAAREEIEVKERVQPEERVGPAAKTRAKAGDRLEKKKEVKPAA